MNPEEPLTIADLERFLVQHRPVFLSLCRRFLQNAQDAEDACQTAMIRAVTGFPGFQSVYEAQLMAWMKRIVTTTCLTELERVQTQEQRTVPLPNDEVAIQNHSTGETELEQLESKLFMQAYWQEAKKKIAGGGFPWDRKDAAIFAFIKQQIIAEPSYRIKYAPIGESLRLPAGTVRSRYLARVQPLMQEILIKMLENDPFFDETTLPACLL